MIPEWTDKQTERQTDRQTDSQRQIGRQTVTVTIGTHEYRGYDTVVAARMISLHHSAFSGHA